MAQGPGAGVVGRGRAEHLLQSHCHWLWVRPTLVTQCPEIPGRNQAGRRWEEAETCLSCQTQFNIPRLSKKCPSKSSNETVQLTGSLCACALSDWPGLDEPHPFWASFPCGSGGSCASVQCQALIRNELLRPSSMLLTYVFILPVLLGIRGTLI